MNVVKANDRVLFIKRGDFFLPVACLTSNGMSESVEMIPTTTRFSQGWETSRPNLQSGSISFEGLSIETIFNTEFDQLNQTQLFVTFNDQNNTFILPNTSEVPIQFSLFFNGSLVYTLTIVLVTTQVGGSRIQKGITFLETMQNIVAFIGNVSFATVTANSNGFSFNFTDLGNWSEGNVLTRGDYTINFDYQTTIITNPFQLVSYDRLKLIKRNRERITWRVRSLNPFVGRYFDEGEGYIVEISDDNPVGQDSTFSGTIQMWGQPKMISNNLALSADENNFLEDGNDNLIEP